MTPSSLPPYYTARQVALLLGYPTPQHFHVDRRRNERAWDPETGAAHPLPAFPDAPARAAYVKGHPLCAPSWGGYKLPGQDWRFDPGTIHALVERRRRAVNLPAPPLETVNPDREPP